MITSFFFCYISRKCVYASPPPLFFSTHSHTQYPQALLHLTWEGLHRRTCSAPPWHFNRPFIGGPFQNQTAMCSLCARELSNRMKESEGGGLNEDSSSFSFFLPQPAFDLAVCPPLNTQAAVWEGRVWCHTQSGCVLNIVNARLTFLLFLSHCLLSLNRLLTVPGVRCMLVCNFSFTIIFGVNYSTEQTSLSSLTPTAHRWQCSLDLQFKSQGIHNIQYGLCCVCANWIGQHSSFLFIFDIL